MNKTSLPEMKDEKEVPQVLPKATYRRNDSAKSGLVFPVSRVQRQLKRINSTRKVSKGASVYLTAVLEYLSSEVLDVSGMAARQQAKKRITPRHILLGVHDDLEMKRVLGGVVLPQSGVAPSLQSLRTSKKQKKGQGKVKKTAGRNEKTPKALPKKNKSMPSLPARPSASKQLN